MRRAALVLVVMAGCDRSAPNTGEQKAPAAPAAAAGSGWWCGLPIDNRSGQCFRSAHDCRTFAADYTCVATDEPFCYGMTDTATKTRVDRCWFTMLDCHHDEAGPVVQGFVLDSRGCHRGDGP